MSELLGFVLLFVIPGFLATVFWWLVRPLVRSWEARDVMDRFRPDRRDVAAAERRIDDIYLEVFTP